MKTSLSVFAVASLALALAGCGGSGGGSAQAPVPEGISRTMVGYVWVKDNAGHATGPDIMVTASTTPPTGYFKPTAGTITLHVDDGELIGRASDDYVRNMADGNDIIVAAMSQDPFLVQVSASGVELDGTAKPNFGNSTASYSEDLSLNGATGTTLAMASPGSPSYTPGPPSSMSMKVNGAAPPTELISGGTYSLAVAFFDVNGVAISGLTPTVTSTDPTRVAVSGTYDLAPAGAASMLAAGPVTIRAALSTNNSLSGDFTAAFNYGSATTVTVAPAGPTDLLWNTVGAPATMNLTATVNNQFAAPMFAATVDWSNAKAPGNVWDTTTGGACFSAATGATDGSGQMVVTVSAPISVAGPLAGADKNPKGLNTVAVVSGSVNGSAQINITRPIGSLVIDGPAKMDVGTTSAATGPDSFRITDALDVDNDPVPVPGGITWTLTNTPGAGTVGNVGDTTPQSTSAASADAAGVVSSGNIAGQATLQASSGLTLSNVLTIDIWGTPAKILYTPDTVASVLGAGEYAGAPGGQQAFSVSMIDSWGHVLPAGEISGFTTTSSTDSLSGANITNGGLGVTDFTITFGSGDGTFSIGTTGTWTGTSGGAPSSFSITKTAGLNVP